MAGENEPKTPVKAYLELANTYVQKAIRDTPNGLTLANLTCGLFSLMMAINGLHRIGALLIFLAAICGYFDGHVARKLQATSEIGAQLDSLANLVSFGVAPAILAHSIRNWSYLMLIAFVSFP
jgi:CDP-diacylglycerol--serine O-phosphatidyltransferase